MDLASAGLLLLYIGITVIGYFVGKAFRNKHKKTNRIAIVQMVVVVLLVFIMGTRIGANEDVIKNLDSLGLTSFIFTLCVMFGSAAAVFITRKLMGISREGVKEND